MCLSKTNVVEYEYSQGQHQHPNKSPRVESKCLYCYGPGLGPPENDITLHLTGDATQYDSRSLTNLPSMQSSIWVNWPLASCKPWIEFIANRQVRYFLCITCPQGCQAISIWSGVWKMIRSLLLISGIISVISLMQMCLFWSLWVCAGFRLPSFASAKSEKIYSP